ncbi:ATP-binding protein [Streptomyces sp. RLB1-33]|nr:ATP-binding protein [Streptomyces sp. RLB1-33]
MTVRPGADLAGRTAELELIDSLLAGEYRAGPGVLLRGDPGVGKSALLNAAEERATAVGRRVLRASGVEFEAGMNFSALHRLLYPLRERAGRLADRQRDALHHILGLAPGPSPDPLVASTALLALLDGPARPARRPRGRWSAALDRRQRAVGRPCQRDRVGVRRPPHRRHHHRLPGRQQDRGGRLCPPHPAIRTYHRAAV